MQPIYKQSPFFLRISLLTFSVITVAGCNLRPTKKYDVATSENLSQYELPTIEGFSSADKSALDNANSKESPSDLLNDFKQTPEIKSLEDSDLEPIFQNKIHVDIYEKATSIGKQFLVVKVNNEIKYVFATSTGTASNPTPKLVNVVATRQKFRHMSLTYPGTVNNMDFVTYFYPSIGFHSTTFGNYPKLGRADSHGCVRLGKPQARILYRLIKDAGKENTTITVIKRGEPEETEDKISLIRTLLAKDLNFISHMIKSKNSGDVSGVDEETYYKKILGNTDEKSVIEIVLESTKYYNSVRLPRENQEIDRLNKKALEESELTGIPPRLIRPFKKPIQATLPILEMIHWESVEKNILIPVLTPEYSSEYALRIYPVF